MAPFRIPLPAEMRVKVNSREASIQKHHKLNGLLASNPKEAGFVSKNRNDYNKMLKLSDEKVALAEKGVRLLEKYVARLDGEFERLKDMGYNIGDAEAAHAASAAPSPALSGTMPQLDFSSSTSSNKKRKMGSQPMPQTPGLQNSASSSTPSHMQLHHPFAAGTPTQSGMPGPNYGNAGAQSPVNANAAYAAGVGQYNGAGLTPQQQQQLAQAYQNQFPGMGQLQTPGSSGTGGGGGPGGAANANTRPHRPSRLSSSFSAGVGDGSGLLPSSTAAHLPPTQSAASAAASGPQARDYGPTVAASAASSTKRGRPADSKQASGAASRKKKKRIMISDEESGAGDGTGEEDGEGEDDDGTGDEAKSALSSRKAGVASGVAAQKAASRAGTPLSSAPTPASTASASAAHHKSKSAHKKGAAKAGSKKKEEEEDEEEEEEDADAEGEEDWGAEADETNADDPTLYCFCHRVSYGNVSVLWLPNHLREKLSLTTIYTAFLSTQMIACDNPNCKYEWFHWACVKVTKQPDDNQTWYCPECRPLMLGQSNKGSNKHSGGSRMR